MQVLHHPPTSALHVEHKDWTFWQEFSCTSKFRGKYLQIIPLGVAHLKFTRSGNHYTWRKVNTTVQNIIVGKLWIDNVSQMGENANLCTALIGLNTVTFCPGRVKITALSLRQGRKIYIYVSWVRVRVSLSQPNTPPLNPLHPLNPSTPLNSCWVSPPSQSSSGSGGFSSIWLVMVECWEYNTPMEQATVRDSLGDWLLTSCTNSRVKWTLQITQPKMCVTSSLMLTITLGGIPQERWAASKSNSLTPDD